MGNVPATIRARIGRNLHNRPDHPVGITKRLIQSAFPGYTTLDDLPPLVTVRENFDVLRIPADHTSRRTSDTYYEDEGHVLRTHTSAHQVQLLASGHERFLVTGDVYRKDEIDATHYPVFHQMEGVCLTDEPAEGLRRSLFGPRGGAVPRRRVAA